MRGAASFRTSFLDPFALLTNGLRSHPFSFAFSPRRSRRSCKEVVAAGGKKRADALSDKSGLS